MIAVAATQLQGIEAGLQFYTLKNEGQFPRGTGSKILESLTKQRDLDGDGKLDGPWLDKTKDPWGNSFNYEWPHKREMEPLMPAVWSNGPNGLNENGGGDDIVNWPWAKTKK